MIFRSSRLLMFSKIGVLRNFAIFTGKHLCWPLQAFFHRTPTVAASGFSRQQILFFHLNVVVIADSCIGFCSELLWKHELDLRSSHWNSSVKEGVLRNFANFTGKHLCWSLFSIELEVCSFIKKILQRRCFAMEFTKFLMTPNSESGNDCSFHLDCPF